MSLLKIGAELFLKQLGNSGNGLNTSSVSSALSKLLPTNKGDLDLSALVGQFSNGNLASLATSWLGNASNDAISPAQILSLFGDNKMNAFASSLNIDINQASQGLAGALPQLIDQNSKGGELTNVAKGILGKFF